MKLLQSSLRFFKIISSLVIVLLFPSFSFAQQDKKVKQIATYLEKLSEDQSFSLSIAISKNDKLVFQKGYGYANREHQIPSQPNTKFNIASIGKMFTAVAVLQLYEQNKIDLNQTVGKYLPDFPNKNIRDAVTIHQLLTHSSGLPIWPSQEFAINPKFSYLELQDYLPLFENVQIDSIKVGSSSYSNVGFILLGFVIEAVSEMPYKKYLQQFIFEPTEMKETGLWNLTEIIPNAAVGYVRPANKNDYWRTNFYKNMSANPAGGAYSTVLDLTKFYQALRHHKLLSPATTTLMFLPKTSTPSGDYGYGYGIATNVRNNKKIVGHLGGFFGIRGELMWYQEADYTVAILANSDQTDHIELSYFIETILVGTPEEQSIHKQTQSFIEFIIRKEFEINPESIEGIIAEQVDESLMQIKGYHFFNNKRYTEAELLFRANALIFPESESAKNDLAKVKVELF